MKTIARTILIDAGASAVWDTLVAFQDYPQWSSFIRSIEGRLEVGSKLAVSLQPNGTRTFAFRPTLLAVAPCRELRWLGHLGVPGLFDGEHGFILDPAQHQTRFTQTERFSGLLVPLLGGMLRDTEAAFDRFNHELKQRVEQAATFCRPDRPEGDQSVT